MAAMLGEQLVSNEHTLETPVIGDRGCVAAGFATTMASMGESRQSRGAFP
jgi:hypothetical protein